MMDFKFKTTRKIKRIAEQFNVTQKKAETALKKTNRKAALFIWKEAKKRTPKRRGDLEASGSITPTGPALKHMIMFDTDYARKVHEWNDDHGLGPISLKKQARMNVKVGYKYLQRANDENKKEIVKLVKDNLRRLLGGTSN